VLFNKASKYDTVSMFSPMENMSLKQSQKI